MRRLFIVVLPLLCAGYAVGYFYFSPVRLATLVALGRGHGCSVEQAIASPEHPRNLTRIKDRILRASKLIQKDPAGYHLWQTPKGNFWITDGSDYMLPYNLAEQEDRIYGRGEQFVRPGDIVLDCGANVGVFTRVALAAGARLVVAIEIAPENLECLRRNLEAEVKAGRVVIYPKGVWDKEDVLTLTVAPGNSPADTVVMHPPNSRPGPQVPLTTIDKIVAELKLERVDFIKMDIEGAEQRALKGARQAIERFRPRMSLASYHVPGDAVEIPRLAREGWPGYRVGAGPCSDLRTSVRPDVIYFW